jgi:hypothetical protein
MHVCDRRPTGPGLRVYPLPDRVVTVWAHPGSVEGDEPGYREE